MSIINNRHYSELDSEIGPGIKCHGIKTYQKPSPESRISRVPSPDDCHKADRPHPSLDRATSANNHQISTKNPHLRVNLRIKTRLETKFSSIFFTTNTHLRFPSMRFPAKNNVLGSKFCKERMLNHQITAFIDIFSLGITRKLVKRLWITILTTSHSHSLLQPKCITCVPITTHNFSHKVSLTFP